MSLTLRSAEPRRLETDAPLDTRAVVVPRSRKTPKVRTGSISRPGRPSPLVTTIKWVVIVVAIGLALGPILYMVGMSFKSPDDILSTRILPSLAVAPIARRVCGPRPRQRMDTHDLAGERQDLLVPQRDA